MAGKSALRMQSEDAVLNFSTFPSSMSLLGCKAGRSDGCTEEVGRQVILGSILVAFPYWKSRLIARGDEIPLKHHSL